ncbi:MAG: hypothetical protein A3A97_00440 [Candidatus Terrybacteria bacterium RIFCSPLOWO2_01_FULL_40_23]|uniref:DNA-directed DNA polymerase n=1 Tax=Candidatus Terrybacteria bacterium RIFCSPLOWO2_01_FULL_40_23 TaxID=1802366 RepID=A0A1G2PWV4_9BACT|nr:MAG: hypothetical protein A3A97_00440 [Candidatus Terrybacteria bacterium RIFCSPLOWO2_01_FULL_40_23]
MSKKKQLLIIDTSALFHRAFHALPPLTTPAGEPIQAIFGLASLLIRVLNEIKPDYVIAALDSPGKTFRHDLSVAYKATRPEPPSDLKAQFSKIPELLHEIKIPMLAAEGFEADDVIGTVADKISKSEEDVSALILTSDKDVWQLIDDKTTVLALKRGVTELERVDEGGVLARFGVAPKYIPDYKAIAGDASDNIPGVRGMGEKTTFTLLSKFSSLENLYAELGHSEDKLIKRFEEKLQENKGQAILSRTLATIRKDAPVVFKLEDFKWQTENLGAGKKIFEKWGFTSLTTRINKQNGDNADASGSETTIIEIIDEAEKKGMLPPQIARLERELMPIFKEMTETGILIDTVYLKKLSKEIKKIKENLEKELFELAGREFNPASSDQVREILIEKMGNQTKRLRKTPGGKASTAVRELKRLGQTEPLVEKILSWREIAKLLSTYVDALPKSISPKDGRIHTTFLQLGAATGRISSIKPNLQNIPIKSELGHLVRNAFVASPGKVLFSSDYSQIELRVIAHLSQDPTMRVAFQENQDIHRLTAAKIFHVDLSNVTSTMRSRAKTLNFGILYGMGPRRLAEETDMNEEEAREFISEYFAQFPAVADWINNTKKQVKESGYVETMFGRRRLIPEIFSQKAGIRAQGERAAVNMPIQGSAADIVKMALVACFNLLKPTKGDAKIILQVHDEIVFEIKEEFVDEIASKIKKTMEKTVELSVPLEVTISFGKTWGDMAILEA